VAVVGTGVIGRSWIPVFARADIDTRVYDADPAQRDRALAWFEDDLAARRDRGELKKKEIKSILGRVRSCATLADALEGVGYVQESGPERLDLKQAIYGELDATAAPGVILGSSTSAIDMTQIADGLPGRSRCIVAHPVNPPHVVPVVEVLGGRDTSPEVVAATIAFLKSVGQSPVLMKRFAPGFILNRMQAALIREAVDLVASGVADVEAVDTCIRDGLGLRWAFMGPFAVANTNADGGVGEYFTRYRGAYHGLWADLNTDVQFDDQLVSEPHRQTAEMLGEDREAQRAWRDRMIEAIRRTRSALPLDGSSKKRKTKKRKAKKTKNPKSAKKSGAKRGAKKKH